jgi:hypothetical protein
MQPETSVGGRDGNVGRFGPTRHASEGRPAARRFRFGTAWWLAAGGYGPPGLHTWADTSPTTVRRRSPPQARRGHVRAARSPSSRQWFINWPTDTSRRMRANRSVRGRDGVAPVGLQHAGSVPAPGHDCRSTSVRDRGELGSSGPQAHHRLIVCLDHPGSRAGHRAGLAGTGTGLPNAATGRRPSCRRTRRPAWSRGPSWPRCLWR